MAVDSATSAIDEALGDYSQERVPADPTGMAELTPILGSAKQVYDAARISGFTDSQAFQIARDYFLEIFRQSAAAASQ